MLYNENVLGEIMATKTFTVTIRKEVPDYETAEELYEIVKQRLADKPGLRYSATYSNHFGEQEGINDD